jgi:hypothetical protein
MRNDYTGFIGMQITTGTKYLSVSSLGRFVLSGNTQPHLVKIVDTSTGLDVGSVTVNTAGVRAGQFAYAALPSPVTLVPGISYFVVSQEASGGDSWYNSNTMVTTTSDASVIGPASGGLNTLVENYTISAAANQEYGPVDFLYSYRAQPPLQAGFTPITSSTQITGPGNYQMVADLVSLSIDNLSDVVLDGGGFQVSSVFLTLINASQNCHNVRIQNCRFSGIVSLSGDAATTLDAIPPVTFGPNNIVTGAHVYCLEAIGNNLTISGNVLAGTVGVTDDVLFLGSFDDTAPQRFVTVTNNLIMQCYDGGIEGIGPYWQNMTFTGNTFRGDTVCAIGMWYTNARNPASAPTNSIFENNTADSTVGVLFRFNSQGSLLGANDDTTANGQWPGNTFSGNTHTS